MCDNEKPILGSAGILCAKFVVGGCDGSFWRTLCELRSRTAENGDDVHAHRATRVARDGRA